VSEFLLFSTLPSMYLLVTAQRTSLGILKMLKVISLEVKRACLAYHTSSHYLRPSALVVEDVVI
jgi:hypothetical protein